MLRALIILAIFCFTSLVYSDDRFFLDVKDNRSDFSFDTANKTKIAGTSLKHKKQSPCVLMIHGFSESKEYFEHFGKHFFKEGFDVHMVNMPDHGLTGSRSVSGPNLGSFDDLMAFCKSSINKIFKMCGRKKVNIVTHSMGGMSCVDIYLNGGVNRKNGKMVMDPDEAKRISRKIGRVIPAAPPAQFEVNDKRWLVFQLLKKLPLEKWNGFLVNAGLTLNELLKSGITLLDKSIATGADYTLRYSPIVNGVAQGFVAYNKLDPGEAKDLDAKMNKVGPKLIETIKRFGDTRRKEFLNRSDADVLVEINWKNGGTEKVVVPKGQMLIWHKDNNKWVLGVMPAPEYVLNEKYPNPFMDEHEISRYRSDDGKIIYAGIPANPNVEMMYIGGEDDRLADPLLIERKVKNSKSKKASFLMVKETDHINLMFGKRAVTMLGDIMTSFLKTGLSKETVKLIDANEHVDLNTNDTRYTQTHNKVPRVMNYVKGPDGKSVKDCEPKWMLARWLGL